MSWLRRLKARLLPAPPKPIHLAAHFVFAEAVPGDYLEFGVFRGASFVEAYHACEAAAVKWRSPETNRHAHSDHAKADAEWPTLTIRQPMRYFAFDSFQGLPPLTEDDEGHSRFRAGRYACSEPDFLRILQSKGVNLAKVTTCAGFFEQSLTKDWAASHQLTQAAIIMVDCDLLESTKAVLDFITPLLQDGTILIFDDWFAFRGHPGRGEQLAVWAWLKQHPEIHLAEYARSGIHQKAFVVSILKEGV